MEGIFIALEGIDTCGKSTQAEILADRLQAERFKFPDPNSPMGKLVYAHLSKDWEATLSDFSIGRVNVTELDAMVFQSLQLSCRMEHAPAIKKALKAGKHVVTDRYTASGIVYGGADGLDMHYLDDIQSVLPQPTLQILLDIDPDDARRRMRDRGEELDRYEAKEGFMTEVAKRYRLLFENKARTAYSEVTTFWSVIDARGSVVETGAKILEEVRQVKNYFFERSHASLR